MIRFDPPVCANPLCSQRVSREAWLYRAASARFCSRACAATTTNQTGEASTEEVLSTVHCANPECRRRLTKAQVRAGTVCCSLSCAKRWHFANKPPSALGPKDPWERTAPTMGCTKALRDYEARALFLEEAGR